MKRFRLIEEFSTQFDRAKNPEGWEADRVDYIATIKQVLRMPLDRQGGATPDEMRRSIRVLDALDPLKLGEILQLEDADWEHLKAKTLNFPWGLDDRRLLRFITTIEQATESVLGESVEREAEEVASAAETGSASA